MLISIMSAGHRPENDEGRDGIPVAASVGLEREL
jgi:hypothetical protein